MIIANGTIEIKRKTGGGIDQNTGFPTPSEAAWSAPIQCQYTATRYNNMSKSSQGEFVTSASYNILIEESNVDSEQLRLRDKSGVIIGEYAIIQAELLEAVGQIRITI